MAEHQDFRDQDAGKGAVEGRDQTNSSLRGQNPHRTSDPLIKANDTDVPEPGGSPEHSGEPREQAKAPKTEENARGFTRDQHGRPHQDTGVARRGSTLSHEPRGARNANSNAPGLKAIREEREAEQVPAEGADIKARRSPDREQVNQDPGQRQKQLHNDEKDDPLAA